MAKLRLLKVMVQPVFAIDDGENLMEQVSDVIAVPAVEWPTYATTQFAEAFEELRQRVEGAPTS